MLNKKAPGARELNERVFSSAWRQKNMTFVIFFGKKCGSVQCIGKHLLVSDATMFGDYKCLPKAPKK